MGAHGQVKPEDELKEEPREEKKPEVKTMLKAAEAKVAVKRVPRPPATPPPRYPKMSYQVRSVLKFQRGENES